MKQGWVEEILPDREVGEIIQQKIIPDFQQDKFDRGTVAGTEALIKILQQQPSSDLLSPLVSIVLVWLISILFAISMATLSNIAQRNRKNGSTWEGDNFGDSSMDFGGGRDGGFDGGCSDGGDTGGHQ
ncbi:MAG: hypothetical protein J7647_23870 [Cyanobacteria bacterium SBLK]|nr:hypothetical protein [Cyanobacteria bacterium SBLK]